MLFFLRACSALLLAGIACLVLLMYLPASNEAARGFIRALGGHAQMHVLVGALLPLCIALLLRLYRWPKSWQWLFWGSCLMLFALDESMQRFSVLRASQLADFGWSALGWGIGCAIWWLFTGLALWYHRRDTITH